MNYRWRHWPVEKSILGNEPTTSCDLNQSDASKWGNPSEESPACSLLHVRLFHVPCAEPVGVWNRLPACMADRSVFNITPCVVLSTILCILMTDKLIFNVFSKLSSAFRSFCKLWYLCVRVRGAPDRRSPYFSTITTSTGFLPKPVATHQTGNVPVTFPEGYNQVSR